MGEHDLTTAGESSYTKEFGINRVIIHENYNPDNGDDNDIAIIVIDSIITFNFGVSPSCLPFRLVQRRWKIKGRRNFITVKTFKSALDIGIINLVGSK